MHLPPPRKQSPAPAGRHKRINPMKTITLHIPRPHWRTFTFYANHYGLRVESLLECECYSRAGIFMDSPFQLLESLEALPPCDDCERVELAFADEVHALFVRLAHLLRRPLPELLSGLLCDGADTLARYIAEALKGEGMDADSHLAAWMEETLRFEVDARRNIPPRRNDGLSCWDGFEIQKPARSKARMKEMHQA
jgi:hypothetical protein